MGWDAQPAPGAYVEHLAQHARQLQTEAQEALARGDFTRASRLIGDAELLAEDVHDLVTAMERREMMTLACLAAYDVRAEAGPAPAPAESRMSFSPRTLKLAIGAGLAVSLALTEF